MGRLDSLVGVGLVRLDAPSVGGSAAKADAENSEKHNASEAMMVNNFLILSSPPWEILDWIGMP